MYFFFFFQAEDGIRDVAVTGVQTCALPIFPGQDLEPFDPALAARRLLDRRVEHPPRGAPDVRPGAVALDEGDDGPVGHDPAPVLEPDALTHVAGAPRGISGAAGGSNRCSLHGPGGVAPPETTHLELNMRRAATLVLLLLAAACWLAAGPRGQTIPALLLCRPHTAHQSHAGHHHAPADAPCFCDQMTGGLDLAVSPAVPAPLDVEPVIATPLAASSYASLFPLPASPAFPPASPPPNGLV